MALDGTANGVESIQTGSGADAITIGAAAAGGNAQSVTTSLVVMTYTNIGATTVNFTFDGGPGVDTVSFAASTNMSTKSMTLTIVVQIQLIGGGGNTQTINASFYKWEIIYS